MPVGKRATKVVCYNEQDDDDDFMPAVDRTKKNRNNKSNLTETEVKRAEKHSSKKQEEKLPQIENTDEIAVIAPCPKESSKEVIVEDLIVVEKKESSDSQSTVLSIDSKTSSQSSDDVDDKDEDLSPKSKRMKHEDDDETEEVIDDDENSSPKPIETVDKTESSIVSSNSLSKSRTVQQNSSTRTSLDPPTKRSSAPLGFPTSKINIPSPHVFRVGLSRKSSAIKPLHPNLASRAVHD